MTAQPIKFVAVTPGEAMTWRRPGSFSFANQISQVPLASSEVLLSSHHLPVAIDYFNDRPRVVAIVSARFQRSAAVSPEGRWLKGYMPIALRCLPFRLSEDSARRLEIATNLDEADEPNQLMFDSTNALTPQVRQIEALLHQLEDGKRELQMAAEKLLIADVLRPFQLTLSQQSTAVSRRSFTVDRNKFDALSNSRIAYIVKDNFLPVDLAAACIFSQRLMATLVSVVTDDQHAQRHLGPDPAVGFQSGLPPEAQVDAGELFSFEHFAQTDPRYDKSH